MSTVRRGYTQADRRVRNGTHPVYSRLSALRGLAGALVQAAWAGSVSTDWTHVFVSGVLKLNNTWDLAFVPLDMLVEANTTGNFEVDRDFLARSLNLFDPPQANQPDPGLLALNTAVCTRFLQELATGPMTFAETRSYYANFR